MQKLLEGTFEKVNEDAKQILFNDCFTYIKLQNDLKAIGKLSDHVEFEDPCDEEIVFMAVRLFCVTEGVELTALVASRDDNPVISYAVVGEHIDFDLSKLKKRLDALFV